MNSPNHSLSRWFRGGGESSPSNAQEKGTAAPRSTRRSIGFGEFMRSLQSDLKAAGEQRLSILDLGSTSAANIAFFTEMGLRLSTEDVLRACKDPDYLTRQDDGLEQFDPQKFLADNLTYSESQFDAVLCCEVTDSLAASLVKPLVERIHYVLKPHGTLLAFFHDKDPGPNAALYRYHISQSDTLEMEPKGSVKIQRIFNNRHVESLFADFASRKFFLGRDNYREVIVVR